MVLVNFTPSLLNKIDTTTKVNRPRTIPQYHFSQTFIYFTFIFLWQFLQTKTILLHGMAPSLHTSQKPVFGFCEHLGHLAVNILKT